MYMIGSNETLKPIYSSNLSVRTSLMSHNSSHYKGVASETRVVLTIESKKRCCAIPSIPSRGLAAFATAPRVLGPPLEKKVSSVLSKDDCHWRKNSGCQSCLSKPIPRAVKWLRVANRLAGQNPIGKQRCQLLNQEHQEVCAVWSTNLFVWRWKVGVGERQN